MQKWAKLLKPDQKAKTDTLSSKMMSKALDVASSTSYTARTILWKSYVAKVNVLFHIGKKKIEVKQLYLKDLLRIGRIWWKMLIFKLLIIQAKRAGKLKAH